jgi:DNA-binding CsgD family transcriptional regulator
MDALLNDGATLHGFGRSTAGARIAFASGNANEAVALLHDVYDNPENLLMHQMTDVPFVPELLRIARAAGVPRRADAIRETAHLFATRNPATRSIVGAAAHAEGLADDDPDRLRDAVDHYRLSPRPLWLAVGLEDFAVALTGDNQRSAAITHLEEAMTLFLEHGAIVDADRVRARLRQLGVRKRLHGTPPQPTTGWDAISPAERKVAELASEGLSNRAIADRLYISPHTVNAHLNHIFVKLGIHSRVELAARRAQHFEQRI